ncbi:unnamed protein product [Cylicocyclus nassatus]|uniref:AB hydrolase-1 domain-containing protein n=1 Tax=Cylicocyclus nassatus TaxID=53992 RepID=A0AA36H3R6_CYLNA|nr:unnamed protein product [Cylicocyclus nassatus]
MLRLNHKTSTEDFVLLVVPQPPCLHPIVVSSSTAYMLETRAYQSSGRTTLVMIVRAWLLIISMVAFVRGARSSRNFRDLFMLTNIRLQSQNASKTTSSAKPNDDLLRQQRVQYSTSAGEIIDVEAVFQDTLPSGSSLGTVVAIHGAPGSHKDFKYVTPLLQKKGIRFIGVNMPGFGFTPGDSRLKCDNMERNNFVHGLLSKIAVTEKVVIMGHSRGTENAANVAAWNTEKLSGLVLLNPTGLQFHRGMRPFWAIKSVLTLYSLGSIVQRMINPIMKYIYNNVLGLRLDSGERAMMCLRTMYNLEYEKAMRPSIDAINRAKNVRVLILYSGKDPLIEETIPQELASSFLDHKELVYEEKSDAGEQYVTERIKDFYAGGARTISVNFKKDGHFLQRDRAHIIADGVEAMLRS